MTDTHLHPMTDDEIKKEKPLSADFVSFRAGVRCAERLYQSRIAELEKSLAQQGDYIKGFADCREYMAKFVEPQSAEIAASIRANWNPDLGADPMVVQCENCGGIGAVGELVRPDISAPEHCDSCAGTGVWRIAK